MTQNISRKALNTQLRQGVRVYRRIQCILDNDRGRQTPPASRLAGKPYRDTQRPATDPTKTFLCLEAKQRLHSPSAALILPVIFTRSLRACGRSPPSRCDRPYVLSAALIIFSRFGRVGLTQNGGPEEPTRMRRPQRPGRRGVVGPGLWVMGARFESRRGRGVGKHDGADRYTRGHRSVCADHSYPSVASGPPTSRQR